jgi:hypothetical protein
MKTILLLLFTIPTLSFSQWYEEFPYKTAIDFDTDYLLEYLYRDTVSNPDNIWQIGAPNKTVLNSAESEPNVIITDTVNSYPINDTSSFILIHEMVSGLGYGSTLSGSYFVDSDNGNDFGKIELSPDNGISWVLISDDTLRIETWPGSDSIQWPTEIYDSWSMSDSLSFSGESGAWHEFMIHLENAEGYFDWASGDTVLFRFSFISDGVFDDKDGLMFDNLVLTDIYAFGIDERIKIDWSIFPNPAANIINIAAADTEIKRVEIFNLNGQRLYSSTTLLNAVNIADLNAGSYFLKIYTTEGAALKSFVKQ